MCIRDRYREDLKLTLLDSLNKRLTFLGEVSDRLHLDTKRIHARAEEAGRDLNLRMKFDIVTARAVAPLNLSLIHIYSGNSPHG